ncbi:MAG: site-specific tyrosine recombinase XerD [Chloroflexi bacterium]|jgi:integrase/recombinase XerD|nr:site-specific tyrosine recombinase XerD [Chloroflexota bacterium]
MQRQIDDFLTSLQVEKGYSDNTIVAYRNDLSQFVQFLAEQLSRDSWKDVKNDDLVGYLNCLKWDREYASATVARKVAATKSFFHHLVTQGIIERDPSVDLDSPKVRKYLPRAISEQEVERLLKAPTKDDSSRSLRDSALMEMLYATGMRVSEVVAVNVEDVDLAGGCVHCVNKSSKAKERVIPIYPRAVEALENYLRDGRSKLLRNDKEKALFLNHRGRRLTRQGLWLIIKKYVEEVGIETPVTPHTLRHSFATHLLNGGADVRQVQGLLGHANVSTTQVYTQLNQDKLREVYDEAHPRAH